jgi:hypothetical protein
MGVDHGMQIKANPRIILSGLLFVLAVCMFDQRVSSEPVPPCGPAVLSSQPPYAQLDDPPAVAVWRDITLDPDDCFGQVQGPMELVIALAGRFRHAGTLEDLALRVGAVSSMAATRYWSVSDGRWRPLISEAFAVKDLTTLAPRQDFSAGEILSGRTLYFAQNDTRSTGLNVYSLSDLTLSPDRLAIEIVNVADIHFLLATMYKAGTLVSLNFLEHLEGDVWGYYGLSAIRDGATEEHTKSFINRAAAYHRFITGVPTDAEPALAP